MGGNSNIYIYNYRDKKFIRKSLNLNNLQASGANGDVYAHNKKQLIKIYKESILSEEYKEELSERLLVQSVIHHDIIDEEREDSFAWPDALIFSKSDLDSTYFLGYTMPRINESVSLADLIYDRKINGKALTQIDMVAIAAYIAKLFYICHKRNIYVGDVHHKNILISKKDMFPSLIDCDSFQIRKQSGGYYTTNGGIKEFHSPEILRKIEKNNGWKNIVRNEYDDVFSLSILLFQLLMDGMHPFHYSGMLGKFPQSILNGNYTFAKNKNLSPPKHVDSQDFNDLSDSIKENFERIFCNKGNGIDAKKWMVDLVAYGQTLKKTPSKKSKNSTKKAQNSKSSGAVPSKAPISKTVSADVNQPDDNGLWFSFKGKIGRLSYLWRQIVIVISAIIILFLTEENNESAFLFLLLITLWLNLSCTRQRLRSVNWSPWLLIGCFLPYVNIALILLLLVMPPKT